MTFYIRLVMICISLFAMTDISSAVQELPFNRAISVTEWGGIFNTKESIDQVVDDLSYMNVDNFIMYVGSEYFEAVRDPSKASWDTRASWNMLEYAITKAHEKNIQVHLTHSINIMGLTTRAESRLWGTKYNTVSRSGVVDNVRIDPAFKEAQDYEVNLIGFIANHYPTLDGIFIEEPFYTGRSYSTAMRARVQAKYSYDPLTKPEDQMVPIIDDVARDVFNEFFIKIRASVNANKSNPNLLLSANAADGYRPVHGFDPRYMSDNNLLDWYVAQTNSLSLSAFKYSVERLNREVDDIPAVPVSFITWSSIYPNASQAFIDEVSKSCEYGGNAEFVFAYAWRNKIVNGKTAYEGLHNLPPSSLCGKQSTIVSAPTFSISAGTYSSAQSISISTNTTGATIRYTIDGTTPGETSPVYSSPILISSNITLKARAWKTGYTPSVIASASYTIAIPPGIANYIKNPGFESGITSWIKSTNANVTFSVISPGHNDNYSGKLDINSINTNIQVFQTGIPLEQNTRYKMSFAANSTTGHDLTMKLIKGASPYPTYGLAYTANLNSAWQTFTTEFSTTGFEGNVTDGRIQIWIAPFAAAGDTYYLDDLTLEKVNVNNNIYDLSKDNVVDVYDMNIVSLHFHEITTFPYPNYDINTDGQVDIYDLILVSNNIV